MKTIALLLLPLTLAAAPLPQVYLDMLKPENKNNSTVQAAYEAHMKKLAADREPELPVLTGKLTKTRQEKSELIRKLMQNRPELAEALAKYEDKDASAPDRFRAEQQLLPILAESPEYVKLSVEEDILFRRLMALNLQAQGALLTDNDENARDYRNYELKKRDSGDRNPAFPVGLTDDEKPKLKNDRARSLYCFFIQAALEVPEYAVLVRNDANLWAAYSRRLAELIEAHPGAWFNQKLSFAKKEPQLREEWDKLKEKDSILKGIAGKRVESWRKQQPLLRAFIRDSRLPEAEEFRGIQGNDW